MKKKELLVGLGFPADSEDDDAEYEMTEDEDATERDAKVDEAIDTFLDDKEDIDTRREAFRLAVKLLGDQ